MSTEPTSSASVAAPRRIRVIALVALLVFAGCVTPFGAPGDDEPRTSVERTPDQTSTATATPPANPWGKRTVTVAVVNSAGSWRNVTGSVADALEYWERHDSTYGRYQVDYDLQPSAAHPDIVVKYVTDVSVCGSPHRDGGVGFAPRISANNPPEPPESVCVRAGFSEASTDHVLKHEFGHVLGIDHGEPPVDLMSTEYDYLQVPRPTPALHAASIPRENLAVYVDRSTIFARRDYVARQQLDRVFEYFETGTPESLERVNVTEVETREAADVIFRFPRQSPCERNRPGSCSELRNRSDGRPQLDVAITTTHEDTFGWHAGFWLSFALGADRHEKLPAPFRNASFDDRHRQWWSPNSDEEGSG